MMEPKELAALLARIKEQSEEAYRHLMWIVRAFARLLS